MTEDQLMKKTFEISKTIAMVGVSSIKKEISTNIKRRPSTIVMKYMQEFGYKVIPVNPFSAGEIVHGETIVAKLEDAERKRLDLQLLIKQTSSNKNFFILASIISQILSLLSLLVLFRYLIKSNI